MHFVFGTIIFGSVSLIFGKVTFNFLKVPLMKILKLFFLSRYPLKKEIECLAQSAQAVEEMIQVLSATLYMRRFLSFIHWIFFDIIFIFKKEC
jgi:hypothetical protein